MDFWVAWCGVWDDASDITKPEKVLQTSTLRADSPPEVSRMSDLFIFFCQTSLSCTHTRGASEFFLQFVVIKEHKTYGNAKDIYSLKHCLYKFTNIILCLLEI